MSNDQVYAPFSADETTRIREWQANSNRHPLTCCDHKTRE